MDIEKKIEAFTAHASPVEKLGNSRTRAYIRVSSEAIGQDQRRQIVAWNDFTKGSALTDKTCYLEKNSARGGKVRKVFNNMIKDAKANKFDVLWCEQPSRLSRGDVREGLNIMNDLHELGVKVFFQKFNRVLDLNEGQDEMMFIFYMMVSKAEAEFNSINTKNSNKGKQKILDANGQRMKASLNASFGGGSTWLHHMLIKDPFFNGNENKKGLDLCVRVPYMVEMLSKSGTN